MEDAPHSLVIPQFEIHGLAANRSLFVLQFCRHEMDGSRHYQRSPDGTWASSQAP